MKTQNKKKIVVSALAIAMGAALAGSISGSVAWYQYSTKAAAQIAGTSAGTIGELEIQGRIGSTASFEAGNSSNFLSFDAQNFKPMSYGYYGGAEHYFRAPVYQTAESVEYGESEDKPYVDYELQFQFSHNDGTTSTKLAKKVYLTQFAIIDDSTGVDVADAVRVEFLVGGTKKALLSTVASGAGLTTATKGNLDLNGNTVPDAMDWDCQDASDEKIQYVNKASVAESYACDAHSTVLVPAGYDLPAPSIKLEVVVKAFVTLYTSPTDALDNVGRLANATDPFGLYTLAISAFLAKSDKSRTDTPLEMVPFVVVDPYLYAAFVINELNGLSAWFSSLAFSVSVKSFVDRPLPVTLSTLLPSAVLMTLFCTGLVDDELNAESTVVLFAPVAIPSSLVFNASVKSLVDKPLPDTLSTFLSFKQIQPAVVYVGLDAWLALITKVYSLASFVHIVNLIVHSACENLPPNASTLKQSILVIASPLAVKYDFNLSDSHVPDAP